MEILKNEKCTCIYCGEEVDAVIPSNLTEVEWIEHAVQHMQGCEWIETKAHSTI